MIPLVNAHDEVRNKGWRLESGNQENQTDHSSDNKKPGGISGFLFYKRILLIPVVIRLERTLSSNTNVLGLLRSQFFQLDTNLAQVQSCNLLVEMLGQHVNLVLILAGIGPK